MTKRLCRNLAVAMSAVMALSGLVGCNSSGGNEDTTAAPAATTAPAAADLPADEAPQGTGDSIIKEKRDIVIIDAGGEQDMFGEIVEMFKAEYPDYVKDVVWIPASTGEQVSKLAAERDAKKPYTTLCTNGYDTVAAGIDGGVYINILEKYPDRFADTIANFNDDSKVQLDKGLGYGIPHLNSIGGPMITYWPDKVPNPPKNLDELLAFCKENPGKFAYPRPSNSGAGYAFLQGMPYLAKEENPDDPESWTKVWDYLKEMDQYIDYYTTGSALLYRDFNEGTRWMITTAVGYETNQRVLGAMDPSCKQLFLDDLHWVTDSNFWTIPTGLDPQDEELSLLFMEFTLRPEIQAMLYDHGFMYPGPVLKGVTLEQAPQESQDALNAVITEDLLGGIENYPHVGPMTMSQLVKAMEMWDNKIGANKLK